MKREQRTFGAEYELKGTRLSGFGAVYNSPTTIYDPNINSGRAFTEVVRPGAFDRTLAAHPDILICRNHNVDFLLGRTSSGRAKVWSDTRGMRFEVDLDTRITYANDTLIMYENKDLTGCSFTFGVVSDRWKDNTRELLDCEIYEMGPVALPAYKSATLTGLRSLAEARFRFLEMRLTNFDILGGIRE